jgi:hypothetical protein
MTGFVICGDRCSANLQIPGAGEIGGWFAPEAPVFRLPKLEGEFNEE